MVATSPNHLSLSRSDQASGNIADHSPKPVRLRRLRSSLGKVKVLEIRDLDSLTLRQRRLLDRLLARRPSVKRRDLVAYLIEGVTETHLLQRLLIAPSRDDVRPGDSVEAAGSCCTGAG